MDLLIAMIVMAVVGAVRFKITEVIPELGVEVTNADGETVVEDLSKYPIGTNLEGLYEVDAYTAILKELGLM